MRWLAINIKKYLDKDCITKVTRKEVTTFFNEYMRKGKIRKKDGKKYVGVQNYAKVFKSFWHWYQRHQEEKDIVIPDITKYVDCTPVRENEFVYLTLENVKKMAAMANYKYKMLIWFLFDSGIRAPTELLNIRVDDLTWIPNSNIYQLHIRDEISKTFGRKPKLMLCSQLLKEYIEINRLGYSDYLFNFHPPTATKYLKRLAKKVFSDKRTLGGKPYLNISMYDFRHSSACYWLPRYKSETAFKYRFGWKKSDMIHYYTKLLGMSDTIEDKDLMLGGEAKTKVERELHQLKQQVLVREEQHKSELEELKKMIKEKVFQESITETLREQLKQELMAEFRKKEIHQEILF